MKTRPKSLRIFIRRKKALLRREFPDPKTAEEKIKKFILDLGKTSVSK